MKKTVGLAAFILLFLASYSFAAVPAGTANQLGIGDIVMSVLNEQDFLNQHGGAPTTGTQATWVLCDGRDVQASKYATLTGKTHVPDLVGRYPRGEDQVGKTGVKTPAAGEQMPDSLKNHTHFLDGWAKMDDAKGQGDNAVLRTGFGGKTETTAPNVGGSDETRPKTTVVNFYIRIN